MPSRILRDFRDSAVMATLSDFEERLFVRMIITADDFGRGLANNLHATCFPLADIPKADVQQALYSIAAKGQGRLVRLFKDNTGRILFDIPNFGNKPRAKCSKWPAYEECEQVECNLQADSKQVHADCTSKPVFREPETVNREPEPFSLPKPIRRRKPDGYYPADFLVWYDPYPRKEGKDEACREWITKQNKPPLNDMLSKLEEQKKSAQWMDKGGQFIPKPANYIKDGRWSDQVTIIKERELAF